MQRGLHTMLFEVAEIGSEGVMLWKIDVFAVERLSRKESRFARSVKKSGVLLKIFHAPGSALIIIPA